MASSPSFEPKAGELSDQDRRGLNLIHRLATPAFVIDTKGRVLVWNAGCERLTGVSANEVVGTRDHWTAFYEEPRACLADFVIERRAAESDGLYTVRHRTDEGGGLFAENWCAMPRLGRHLYLAIDASPVRNPEGRLIAAIETLRDITEHKKAEAEIEHLASHDALTGLANRAAYTRALADLDGRKSTFALLLVDIDRFKEINDTLGHAAGDAVLTGTTDLFAQVFAEAFADGQAARIGGDEFAIILDGCDDRTFVASIADTLILRASRGVAFDGTTLAVSMSIGIAMVPADADQSAVACRHADAALYVAKSQGGGVSQFFDPSFARKASSRRAAMIDLRNAMEQRQLALHYQPITRIDGHVVGFEALLRWMDPRRGLVPPAEFIPIAEQSGLIGPIGEWVLRRACADAASWTNPLLVSVNLSPLQFRLGDIARIVHMTLLETGLSPGRLELEITESAMIDNPSRTLATLRRLKSLGVRIAMDDFGSGYSSLGYLQSFPFDKIKLDRSFTARLGQNPQSDAITRAVIGLAHTLSLEILAEGVETVSQRDFLAAERCDLLQGFLFGRPAPLESFAQWTGDRTILLGNTG